MLERVAIVGVLAILLASACGSDEPAAATQTATAVVAPTSTVIPSTTFPTATREPDYSECPVDEATCELALKVVSALAMNDIDALMTMTHPIVVKCPVPRPNGLGGPYPLCEDATVDGEQREGFAWSSGTEGGLQDAASFRLSLEQLAQRDLPLRTIGCAVASGTARPLCEGDIVLAFGPFRMGGVDWIAEVPIARDDDTTGIVGVVPSGGARCTTQPPMWPCQLVVGGDGPLIAYKYWGTDQEGQQSTVDGRYFRWSP